MKFLFIIVGCIPTLVFAQKTWQLEINGGLPYNIPMPLIIKQSGHPTITTWARYYSEPLRLPVYWDIKLLKQKESVVYELELMHHKLYLQNNPPDVQHFGISHGFNLLFFNRSDIKKQYTFRYGGGVIIAHPESEIRGKKFGDAVDPYDLGYYITGPVVQVAISKYFLSAQRIRINTELKLLAAYSHTPIAEGIAHTFYMGVHLVAGIQGVLFFKEK